MSGRTLEDVLAESSIADLGEPDHRAHVAAQIRTWIYAALEEVRDDAADACADAFTISRRHAQADAVLGVVRGRLAGDVADGMGRETSATGARTAQEVEMAPEIQGDCDRLPEPGNGGSA